MWNFDKDLQYYVLCNINILNVLKVTRKIADQLTISHLAYLSHIWLCNHGLARFSADVPRNFTTYPWHHFLIHGIAIHTMELEILFLFDKNYFWVKNVESIHH